MNAMHQYLFDAYRAARVGEPPPPEPGTHDLAVLRAVRDRRRFERVLAGRPARGGLRRALRRAGAFGTGLFRTARSRTTPSLTAPSRTGLSPTGPCRTAPTAGGPPAD
ncbi:hypothetical protein [Streptomyces sp. WAC08241]|uniref:hypothetical protein n=1 Tax=Streptomyces sp. WAC08241 TaxID=2487421 RepID=UPI00269E58B9|nr:hypothetical protein [Streptomyces sp. WAC08241]